MENHFNCTNCSRHITQETTSCARMTGCSIYPDVTCYTCANMYIYGGLIRYCCRCEKIGTCEMCADYDNDEWTRRKELHKNSTKIVDDNLAYGILQMCPECFDEYIEGIPFKKKKQESRISYSDLLNTVELLTSKNSKLKAKN